jgi:hypothetical protein
MRDLVVMKNIDPGSDDEMFSSERGSWNVSRALRDCKAGKHRLYLLDVEGCYAANANIEVDEAKVRALMQLPDVISEPGISVLEDGKSWFIDGHHRLRALHLIGIKQFASYVIEEKDSAPYIVWFNGQRKPPFGLY